MANMQNSNYNTKSLINIYKYYIALLRKQIQAAENPFLKLCNQSDQKLDLNKVLPERTGK